MRGGDQDLGWRKRYSSSLNVGRMKRMKTPVWKRSTNPSGRRPHHGTLATGLSEEDPEEREPREKMWLSEKVTSLEKENGQPKKGLQEMETRFAT